MYVLGIESSCDETAAAIVTADGDVLSNVVSSQIPLHARYGGVIPEIASRNHLMAIGPTVARALDDAGVGLDRIRRIAVTRGPGLIGSLLVGVQFAKTLSAARGIDLVPVHHVEGHITAALLSKGGEHPHGPIGFPYVALAVSGGHTSLYLVSAPGAYSLLAVTLDDAAGEAFDKVARLMGLPYPGGVEIDRLARTGRADAIPFPRPLTGKPAPGATSRRHLNKAPGFSFSGLKTAVRVYMEKRAAGDPAASAPLEDVAASFQEAVVDVLIHKTLEAAHDAGASHAVISGGVAANSRLRSKFVEASAAAGVHGHLTARALCTDNAAMIAGAGRFGTPIPRTQVLALEPFASGQLAALPA
jgi:N6-L-threonylcarbamoyladenine synthase